MSLRYDLTAPLARYFAQNLTTGCPSPIARYRAGLRLPQREAGPGPLPPVHAVRRRHRRRRGSRSGRRNVHDDGRHDGRARLGREVRGQGQQPQGAGRRAGRPPVSPMPATSSPCCAPSTSSTSSAPTACELLLGEGRKDESGDFTKGAGLQTREPARSSVLDYVAVQPVPIENRGAWRELARDARHVRRRRLRRPTASASTPPSSAASNTTPAPSSRLN